MSAKRCIIRAHEFAVDGQWVPGGEADRALEFPLSLSAFIQISGPCRCLPTYQLLRYARSCFYAELA